MRLESTTSTLRVRMLMIVVVVMLMIVVVVMLMMMKYINCYILLNLSRAYPFTGKSLSFITPSLLNARCLLIPEDFNNTPRSNLYPQFVHHSHSS